MTMKIYKAYKFRMYPSKDQELLINKTLGSVRFIYNYYLNKKQTLYKESKTKMSCFECIKDLVNLYVNYPWLKEVDSMSLRCALFDLDNAFNGLYKGKGYPRYKSRNNNKNSYKTNYIENEYKGRIYQNIKIDLKSRNITLPKLKEIKIRGYRNQEIINGKIINVAVSKESCGKYYVSLLVEEEKEIKEVTPGSIVGIDLGIKDLVITSEGKKYSNEKIIQKYEERIKKYQRRLSKKIKGSNNYKKSKEKLSRVYSKMRNARSYITHKITKEITDTYDIIVTETLRIKNMIKNHHISKALTDAALGEVQRQIEYKSRWKGKRYYQIEVYYPSSQICSVCGRKNKKVKNLSVREYECEECRSRHDRDINASINIMYEGLRRYVRSMNM